MRIGLINQRHRSPGDDSISPNWQGISERARALAATTSTIEIGPSIFSAPYRLAAVTASVAETLDEISGGRFIFGLGARNVPDYDYETFGFPTDHGYSRFAEAIEIIHAPMKE
jgi:alkanesulfonate monooxygenase SsuD/methylene tetrahydromethanopterin reductase-like flavin-dependent oxidoreductase (luciferase family)|tara:strand:- start:1968 stop:2306 length:339 start_codon:yes stop_codon:yes gene_type:complete